MNVALLLHRYWRLLVALLVAATAVPLTAQREPTDCPLRDAPFSADAPLIGAGFAGNPIAQQFQTARVVTEDRDGPITRGLPSEWAASRPTTGCGTSK